MNADEEKAGFIYESACKRQEERPEKRQAENLQPAEDEPCIGEREREGMSRDAYEYS